MPACLRACLDFSLTTPMVIMYIPVINIIVFRLMLWHLACARPPGRPRIRNHGRHKQAPGMLFPCRRLGTFRWMMNVPAFPAACARACVCGSTAGWRVGSTKCGRTAPHHQTTYLPYPTYLRIYICRYWLAAWLTGLAAVQCCMLVDM